MRKKTSLAEYFFELIVVIIGITAAFMLNNWREDYKDDLLEKKYLQSLYNDILLEAEILEEIITANEIRLNRAENRSALIKAKTKLPVDSAMVVLNDMMHYRKFVPVKSTYTSIVSSGNLNLISDYELKRDIISYYSNCGFVTEVERIYTEYMNSYSIPFLLENYDVLMQKFYNPAVLDSIRFRNLLAGYLSARRQTVEIYRALAGFNAELTEKLAEYVEK